MKLLFDGTVYQGGSKFHGGGEYANELFRGLIQHLDTCSVEVFFDPKCPRKNFFFDLCKEAGIKMHRVSDPSQLQSLIVRGKFSKVYSALPLPMYFSNLKLPDVQFVFTIHGLRRIELLNEDILLDYEDSNSFMKWKNRFAWSQKCKKEYKEAYMYYKNNIEMIHNRCIITDSNHSKYSLLYYYPELKEDDIKVFYAPRKSVVPDTKEIDISKKYGVSPQKYALIISADRKEKNALRGMVAFDRVFSKVHQAIVPTDYKVIVLGAEKDREAYKKYIKNTGRFIFKKYASAEELEKLYENAHLFLYPTLNEGFGYPPLEAMKYGTLCACSAITSISEICGDAVLYFNPIYIEEIANRILQSFNQDIVNEKKQKMKIQYETIVKRQDQDLECLVKLLIS